MNELSERVMSEADSPGIAINGLLINPFRDCNHKDMLSLVHDFMVDTGLDVDWTVLFTKAAFLAQDKEAFSKERDDGLKLKESERKALKQEDPATGNKYDQPFIMYALVACCSLGAAIQGMDESAINQAQTIPAFLWSLRISNDPSQTYENVIADRPWILGLVNSAPYLCCAVVGCWLTNPLNHWFGRRGTILICCFFSFASCLWQAFTNVWWHMFIARFCLGFGIGPKSATVPIYASECTPKEIRGGVVMMWQLWTALGIMLGYLAGVMFESVNSDLQWRLIVASPMVLPIIVAAYVFTLPESPRWLLRKARRSKRRSHRYQEHAFNSLRRLRSSDLQAARDMFLIYHTLAAEEVVFRQHNRWFELFSLRRNRSAVIASSVCMFLQQMCGVNVLTYYSTLVLQSAGYDGNTPRKLSLGFGIINFVFALPAIPLIDNFGRRSLLLSTFPLMAIFQLLTGLAFLAGNKTMRKVLVIVGMYLFCIAYSPGEGPVPFVYASESMPLYLRDFAMSGTTALNWFFNFLLSITFPSMFHALQPAGTFAYYACWCLIGWWMILLLVPETRNQTLEELDARFSIPARAHALHSLRQLRYWIDRYIMRRGDAIEPHLKIVFTQPKGTKKEPLLRHIPFDDEDEETFRAVN